MIGFSKVAVSIIDIFAAFERDLLTSARNEFEEFEKNFVFFFSVQFFCCCRVNNPI